MGPLLALIPSHPIVDSSTDSTDSQDTSCVVLHDGFIFILFLNNNYKRMSEATASAYQCRFTVLGHAQLKYIAIVSLLH